MKFVKRLSIFFIYPLTMFAMGFASNMAIMEFFYPGEQEEAVKENYLEGQNNECQASPDILMFQENASAMEAPQAEEEPGFLRSDEADPIEVAMSEEPVVTANTHYVLQHYDTASGLSSEDEGAVMPDKFIGLSRDKLVDEIEEYNRNPSLTDLEQGFTYMELVSFSPARVVVKKSYELEEEEKGFFLLNENHYVVVYDHSLSRVYMDTEILGENLPESLQEEILNMKFVENEKELYQFLETYTS